MHDQGFYDGIPSVVAILFQPNFLQLCPATIDTNVASWNIEIQNLENLKKRERWNFSIVANGKMKICKYPGRG